MASAPWRLNGDYFENCNCDVVCPCLFSPNPQLASIPTQGACEVALAFHIDEGRYGDTPLDGLSAVLMVRTPGAMDKGDWSVAVYLDDHANGAQHDALQAIFTGAGGGPIGALAPLISNVLGVKNAAITFKKDGLRRIVEIPGVLQMGVHALPSGVPGSEMWVSNASPFAPSVSFAVGDPARGWDDYGMRWDNSGKNGHYASISWSGT
ncbi:MAG TPA: DUF1326 domain-containing protein [Dehalococcoidia bacterium]|nr:DUF1326 domain-containing protein [Dehalococcoidia bacterium]